MSEDNRYSGRLKKIEIPFTASLEDLCKSICDNKGWVKETYHKGYKECLQDSGDEKYLVYKDEVYEFIELNKLDPYEALIHMEKHQGGIYSFITHYHNGGTCLSEMIEDGLKNFNQPLTTAR